MDLHFLIIHTWSKPSFGQFCALLKQHSVLSAIYLVFSNLNIKILTALNWQGPLCLCIYDKAQWVFVLFCFFPMSQWDLFIFCHSATMSRSLQNNHDTVVFWCQGWGLLRKALLLLRCSFSFFMWISLLGLFCALYIALVRCWPWSLTVYMEWCTLVYQGFTPMLCSCIYSKFILSIVFINFIARESCCFLCVLQDIYYCLFAISEIICVCVSNLNVLLSWTIVL